jgi:hypothetical protein
MSRLKVRSAARDLLGLDLLGLDLLKLDLLKFLDDLFGREFSIRLGRKIVGRNDTKCCPALDESPGPPIGSHGRAPKARSALVGHNRKVGYLGQIASGNGPRARYAAMSTPELADAFV